MPCSSTIKEYSVPNTELDLLICSDCIKAACDAIKEMTITERINFVRFMDKVLTSINFDDIEELDEKFSDYIVLYVAYEIIFNEAEELSTYGL